LKIREASRGAIVIFLFFAERLCRDCVLARLPRRPIPWPRSWRSTAIPTVCRTSWRETEEAMFFGYGYARRCRASD